MSEISKEGLKNLTFSYALINSNDAILERKKTLFRLYAYGANIYYFDRSAHKVYETWIAYVVWNLLHKAKEIL